MIKCSQISASGHMHHPVFGKSVCSKSSEKVYSDMLGCSFHQDQWYLLGSTMHGPVLAGQLLLLHHTAHIFLGAVNDRNTTTKEVTNTILEIWRLLINIEDATDQKNTFEYFKNLLSPYKPALDFSASWTLLCIGPKNIYWFCPWIRMLIVAWMTCFHMFLPHLQQSVLLRQHCPKWLNQSPLFQGYMTQNLILVCWCQQSHPYHLQANYKEVKLISLVQESQKNGYI